MNHGYMRDVPEKVCEIHGSPMRRNGLNYYCNLCRDGVPPMLPSNGSEVMTIIEAIKVLREACSGSESARAAYNRVIGELRILRALKKATP